MLKYINKDSNKALSICNETKPPPQPPKKSQPKLWAKITLSRHLNQSEAIKRLRIWAGGPTAKMAVILNGYYRAISGSYCPVIMGTKI